MIRGKTATVWSLGLVLLLRARAVGSHFEDFGISSAHKHVSGEVPKQALIWDGPRAKVALWPRWKGVIYSLGSISQVKANIFCLVIQSWLVVWKSNEPQVTGLAEMKSYRPRCRFFFGWSHCCYDLLCAKGIQRCLMRPTKNWLLRCKGQFPVGCWPPDCCGIVSCMSCLVSFNPAVLGGSAKS